MKAKKVNSKLVLTKETISNLDSEKLEQVKGGMPPFISKIIGSCRIDCP
ncbi:MAG: hypothetical protein GY940_40370 [bacterium]|nr:hypothetical protein [bacterium]